MNRKICEYEAVIQINKLLDCGFEITVFCESMPSDEMLDIPGMKDEVRRSITI